MDFITTSLIFLIGIAGSFVGGLVGGGGLIKIPFLIFLGIPPQIAIASSKLGSYGGILSASHKFHINKKIDWNVFWPYLLAGSFGISIGASLLTVTNEKLLLKIVGIFLLVSIPVLLLRKDMGLKKFKTTRLKKGIGFLLLSIASIYNGFFGGGSAFITMPITMHFFGLDIIEANAVRYAPAFFYNFLAVAIFWTHGLILLNVAVPLFFGNFIGAYLGVHTAIKKGNETVKTLFVTFVLISAIKMFFF